ncbi:FAD binding domain-containing protein [Ditylenchus destructor]|nr:FAD binding domain-containing protein [Ditylenchus destructor]
MLAKQNHHIKRFYSSVSKMCMNLANKFESMLGSAEFVKMQESHRTQYGHDEGHFQPKTPDLVLLPGSTEEVSAIVRVCNETKIPVIPFGTGTGLEGGVIPTMGGITLDLKRMNQVLEVNEVDFDCTVQPGITRISLNEWIRNTGLWFSVDPGADASVCGMVATGASGTTSVRYGTMKSNVKNLEVVLPNGDIIDTKGKNRRPWKSSAGYNLTDLFVGSEGTLGVITSACVNLQARPPALGAAVCPFEDVSQAIQTVVNIRQLSIPIARVEFLDQNQIVACNLHNNMSMHEKPTLFFEFHGATEREVDDQLQSVQELCRSNQGTNFNSSIDSDGIRQLWKARHTAYYATLKTRPNSKGLLTDVCVPISQLPHIICAIQKDIQQSGLYGTIVGHVGEGNFHCIFPIYEEDKNEMNAVWNLSDKIVRRALSVGGTCTGEHGIGLGKIRYMEEEFGGSTLELMKNIKKMLDPNNIMNPGKIFPN